MKKIVGLALVSALVAGAAFADVSVHAWGRSGLDFDLNTTESDTEAAVTATPSWANGSRVGVNFGASTEGDTLGFNLNLDCNGSTFAVGDQAKIYARLFDVVTVQFGRIQLDTLRGSIGDWGNRQEFTVAGEDALFTRFNPWRGMTLSYDNHGLFIGASICADSGDTAKETFQKVQAGVGYTITDIAQIKVQYIGSDVAKNNGTIEAGVDLLMIPGTLVETGVKVYLTEKTGFKGTVGFKGGYDAVSFIGHITDSYTNDQNWFGIDSGIEYDFGPCAAGLTGGFSYDTKAAYGVEAYAKKGYSNGYLFAGAGYSSSKGVFFPVGAEYWF